MRAASRRASAALAAVVESTAAAVQRRRVFISGTWDSEVGFAATLVPSGPDG